jgi:hypothetical protein
MKKSYFFLLLFFISEQAFAQQTQFKYRYSGIGSTDIRTVIEVAPDSFLTGVNSIKYQLSDSSYGARLVLLNGVGQIVRERLFAASDSFYDIHQFYKFQNEFVVLGTERKRDLNLYNLFLLYLNPRDLSTKKKIIIPINSDSLCSNPRVKQLRDSSFVIMFACDPFSVRPSIGLMRVGKTGGMQSFRRVTDSRGHNFYDFAIREGETQYVLNGVNGLTLRDTNLNVLREYSDFAFNDQNYTPQSSFVQKSDTEYWVAAKGVEIGRNRDSIIFYRQLLDGTALNPILTYVGRSSTTSVGIFKSIDSTKSGNIYLGCASSWLPFSNSRSNLVLTKINKGYNKVWDKSYGNDAHYYLIGILATLDGGCIMYGSRYDFDPIPKTDGFLIKVDSSGGVVSQTNIPMVTPRIVVFPNPSSEFLTIELPSLIGEIDIRIFDAQGKLVLSEKDRSAEKPLNIQELTSGNYVLQVWQKGQLLGVAQWVKY